MTKHKPSSSAGDTATPSGEDITDAAPAAETTSDGTRGPHSHDELRHEIERLEALHARAKTPARRQMLERRIRRHKRALGQR
ncbi:hypothetical protein H0B56_12100 [Haloechinothrix sp. YIM 98757]|uniref:Uncharacterized protein n=1 Tax=Haloechinothrix aidingensis TaxID=2752311 RepID=A0A838AAM2_9PSEU|nr:hypothetical protein [Haloechinothrix aidingensis]MBA0126284.1 hypothetical protein [Haloechinothrix aidingensis]